MDTYYLARRFYNDKPKKRCDNSKEYCIGIYADNNGFSCCLIGIIENKISILKYQLIDEISKSVCSVKEIIKTIKTFQEYADIEKIKINNLPSLKHNLKKDDIETEIKEIVIKDAIFMITSLINDGELKMLNKDLEEIYYEEFNNFDKEVTSYRIFALAIGLTDIALAPSADWLGLV